MKTVKITNPSSCWFGENGITSGVPAHDLWQSYLDCGRPLSDEKKICVFFSGEEEGFFSVSDFEES